MCDRETETRVGSLPPRPLKPGKPVRVTEGGGLPRVFKTNKETNENAKLNGRKDLHRLTILISIHEDDEINSRPKET